MPFIMAKFSIKITTNDCNIVFRYLAHDGRQITVETFNFFFCSYICWTVAAYNCSFWISPKRSNEDSGWDRLYDAERKLSFWDKEKTNPANWGIYVVLCGWWCEQGPTVSCGVLLDTNLSLNRCSWTQTISCWYWDAEAVSSFNCVLPLSVLVLKDEISNFCVDFMRCVFFMSTVACFSTAYRAYIYLSIIYLMYDNVYKYTHCRNFSETLRNQRCLWKVSTLKICIKMNDFCALGRALDAANKF